MKGRKRFHRILAFILALVTGFTTFVTSPEAVYANDEGGNVDFEANISLTPDVNDVVMGNPGSFTLVAQAANPNADKNYEVRIDLPAGSQDWIQGFSSQPTEPGGSYYLNTSVNWLYLYKPNDGSRPYLYFTITNGDIRQTNIAFRPPAGTLSDFELSVSEEDIQVWYEDDVETPIGGTVVKEGGSMYFRNTFDWNPVQKTVDPTSVQVDENGNMASDLTYTVTTSTTDASDLLGMFTRTVTLTDTLTLPGSASFVEGEMRLENGGSGLWNIYIGDVLAGVVQQQNSGSDITTSLTDVQVTGGNTLTFTYTQSTIYTEETAAQYTAEMSAPVYTLTLKKEAVDFTADSISAADIIRNDVGFYAVSWDSTMEDSSSATASTVPVAPGADFTVEKTASSVSWNDETETMDIAWQITVTNTGMLTLDDMVVTDVLPDSLEVTDPVNFTEEGGNYVLRIDEPLAPGDNIVETIQTSVKPNTLTDGATVVNNVSVTAEGITKNGSAQTVYQSPQAPLVMTKDIVVRNEENIETGTLSQVYEGQTFTYEIEVTPNSGASNSFSITELYDVLPEGLTFVSAEIGRWQVVVNGSDQDRKSVV